jgi:hypothetical protein
MDDLTEQERQLIECLRKLKDDYGITVTRENGAWEVAMTGGKVKGREIKGRGVGQTFDAAWDNVTGLQF